MAKNYTYGWMLKEKGYVEVPEAEYTARQIDMKNYIESMSAVIKVAQCGWDGVRYGAMKVHNDTQHYEDFMILYCDGGERWIPITGNSKGCNFSVLGENLW